MTVFTQLRDAREKQNMTRKALAAAVGRSAVSIARYELGTEEPPLRVLRQIAGALGFQVNVVIEPTDNGKKTNTNDTDI